MLDAMGRGEAVVGLALLIIGVTGIIIGVALIVGARYADNRRAELDEKCTASTEAELVDTVCRSTEYTDDISITYHGVHTYVMQDGMRVQAENSFGYPMPEDVPGPCATVRYNPDKPGEFILPEEHAVTDTVAPSLKKAGLITIVLGVPFAIAGVVLFVV